MKKILCLILFIVISVNNIFALIINDIFFCGITSEETVFVQSLLPFSVGDNFKTMSELETTIKTTKSYLMLTNKFSKVDIEIQELDDSKIELYILITKATINNISIFNSSFTILPHFPVYDCNFGFSFSASEQLIDLDILLSDQVQFDLIFGHSQTTNERALHAIRSIVGFTFKPLPLITLSFPIFIDKYLNENQGFPMDIALSLGFKLDHSFLKDAYFFGFNISSSFNKGIFDFDYYKGELSGNLSLYPFSWISIIMDSHFIKTSNNVPALSSIEELQKKYLRAMYSNYIDQTFLFANSIFGKIDIPIKIDLGMTILTPSIFIFCEESTVFYDISTIIHGDFSKAIGCGFMFSFSEPFAITLELGYYLIVEEEKFALLFKIY